MKRRNMFAIWPLIVTEGAERETKKAQRGQSGVRGGVSPISTMLQGAWVKPVWVAAVWTLSRLSVWESVCLCDLQLWASSATVFQRRGKGVLCRLRGSGQQGATQTDSSVQTGCTRTYISLWPVNMSVWLMICYKFYSKVKSNQANGSLSLELCLCAGFWELWGYIHRRMPS